MMVGFAPRPTSGAATGILRRVFGRLASPLGFRLWGGTEGRVGPGVPRRAAGGPGGAGQAVTMPAHDVIVVGGGPGGSTVAWRLAAAGLRPLVLDAAVFPRVKLCAGWVTPQALADLEIDPEKYPLTIQPFSACALAFEGGRDQTRWDRPARYGIIRRE